MKQVKILIAFLCAVFICFTSCSKAMNGVGKYTAGPSSETFKIVGYMFNQGNLDSVSAGFDFRRITHLNIAFINPDVNGMFSVPQGVAAVVEKAHTKKIKVLYSIGGGNASAYLKDLIKPDKVQSLVNNMVAFAQTNNFDGIDVDLEGDFIDANYEPLIAALSQRLAPQKKLLTSAQATWQGDAVSDKTLALFDFINIMAYDHTGPWAKDKPGPHSTYESAVADFNYWSIKRAIPVAKLVLGLPFYGYGFGPDIQESYTYKEIITQYPGSENLDTVNVPNKGIIYYNGMPTIKKKVDFVTDKNAGGVMIWHIFADTNDAKSLLSVINQNKK
ncbi:hypothetical protein FW774_18375 [Pedobacter sp. BS3]|uniref:glycosyl hydrolase family 18 protein n=1 Tax=Pedobacter sp. BS3 TaxID=2567937 RepID=UPI0011ED912C|nr:glycosyl hydrolase family 18 protein [Pedobacter sp. BS3]TZF81519.1 hypothetical protein FW774_18375 [Pedobacter sp. BS3]